ncbi:cysteine hydrolase [Candidatus Thorarchaeota archaeon]|nr:MAG: cysteine hydrolase [Candidatus Thorarchaeota archaeon]
MLELDAERTAIIVVDMLNDFVRDDGALVVPGAKKLIPNQQRILKAARKSRAKVIYLTDNHLPDDDEFEKWPPHAVVGTEGAEVIDELKPEEGDRVIPKRRYSGFFGTDLDITLRESDIETLVLVGVLTDICVMYTSADASAKDYDVIAVEDATDSSKRENHEFAIEHMKSVHATTIASTDAVVQALK